MINDPFAPLTGIRHASHYSSRNASKGAMLPELHRLLSELGDGYSREKARYLVMTQNVLNKKTFENRETVWKRLSFRYFNSFHGWIPNCLIQAASFGAGSVDFLSLAYLYYALRDRITFDFVTSVIWDKWQAGLTHVSTADFLEFLLAVQGTAPELQKWRESTRGKMASITLSALRDFGLLRGTAVKQIQRPAISSEAVYHLLAVLWAEGKRGQAVYEAADWRLFLWREADINNALVRLAQLGWITFERSGSTVLLDLVRVPEAGDGDQI